ncbi:hypothetical protein HOE37_02775 [Candidatus Woesearchaeota archaeon]|jgi:hypothetical protein|nr:hypothetical protein [Candidatus Woesearchaeota archaeon]MBT4469195.1 hypothetical protein [Candidatus Woesearchaeota archaeon]
MFNEFIEKKITIFLKTGRRFSGTLLSFDKEFLRIDDRYTGLKLIARDVVENVEMWKE